MSTATTVTGRHRVEWLDMLRGFAMVCVVFGHVNSVPDDVETWIYSFHMPLFFMISGATFRYGKYQSLKRCIIDQARHLLLPYAVMFIVCCPIWYLIHIVLRGSHRKTWKLIIGFFYANQEVTNMSSNALWFLPTLFLVTVLFWWLTDLDRRGKVDIAASVGGCFLLGTLLSSSATRFLPWHIDCVPMAVVFYYIGHIAMGAIRDHSDDIARMPSSVICLLAIALIAVGTWAAFANGKISVHKNSYHTVALALISSIGISGGVMLVLMRAPVIKPLRFIGTHSMGFLGYHLQVMRILEAWSVTKAWSAAHPIALGVVVIAVLMPCIYLIDRYVPILEGKLPRKSSAQAQSAS